MAVEQPFHPRMCLSIGNKMYQIPLAMLYASMRSLSTTASHMALSTISAHPMVHSSAPLLEVIEICQKSLLFCVDCILSVLGFIFLHLCLKSLIFAILPMLMYHNIPCRIRYLCLMLLILVLNSCLLMHILCTNLLMRWFFLLCCFL